MLHLKKIEHNKGVRKVSFLLFVLEEKRDESRNSRSQTAEPATDGFSDYNFSGSPEMISIGRIQAEVEKQLSWFNTSSTKALTSEQITDKIVERIKELKINLKDINVIEVNNGDGIDNVSRKAFHGAKGLEGHEKRPQLAIHNGKIYIVNVDPKKGTTLDDCKINLNKE